jgi:hypothetical protein
MKYALIGAAALAATAFASPALAQAVIEDPGYCAQFYPNANCQNYGPGNPYTGGSYQPNGWQNGNALMAPALAPAFSPRIKATHKTKPRQPEG